MVNISGFQLYVKKNLLMNPYLKPIVLADRVVTTALGRMRPLGLGAAKIFLPPSSYRYEIPVR